MAIAEQAKSDYHKTVKVHYLKTMCPGISRRKTGKSFTYYDAAGKKIENAEELGRIKALVIPPAWKDVWISPYPNSHLQATGIDARGRKQYRYHPEWSKRQSETKFSKLTSFAKMLPVLRSEMEMHLRQKGIHKDKIIALVIDLMSKSYIRIGNATYARENGSYGLTTLRNKHVDIHGDTIRFVFVGKEGVHQDIELHDKRLARIVKSCRDIPGQALFQYFDHEGNRHSIESGDVNQFIHEVCGSGFSAKDFRTWAGTFHAFKLLSQMPVPQTENQFKHVVAEVAKSVSKVLGNTSTVCRKYYIHPVLFDTFKTGDLSEFYKTHTADNQPDDETVEEMLLIDFLDRI